MRPCIDRDVPFGIRAFGKGMNRAATDTAVCPWHGLAGSDCYLCLLLDLLRDAARSTHGQSQRGPLSETTSDHDLGLDAVFRAALASPIIMMAAKSEWLALG